jgi:hypothetical protein
MANVFADLPMPIGEGAGVAVDVSAMGKDKSIVVSGNLDGATITVEISEDGSAFFPLETFAAPGKRLEAVVAQFMRVFVRNRGASFSGNVDVGSNDNGALFAALPLPAGDGYGTPVDVSALGTFTTFLCDGSFEGATISIEISEDGNDYFPCGESFAGYGGIRHRNVVANWMRTHVQGRSQLPFSAAVSLGAENDVSSALAGETALVHKAIVEAGTVQHGAGANTPDVQTKEALAYLVFNHPDDAAYRLFKIDRDFVDQPSLHMHWTKSADASEDGNTARFQIEYLAFESSPTGEGNGAGTPNIVDTGDMAYDITDANDDRYVFRSVNMPLVGIVAGYYLAVRITSLVPGSGTPVTNPALVSLDLIYNATINQGY